MDTPAGVIPRVGTRLTSVDRWGRALVRWGVGRMRYRVDPGLYAVGEPDAGSPVLVTANYKLTFDSLRASLTGLNAWVLALDTDGVNVWCAAGKGAFGTAELVRRIGLSRLSQVVSHRRLILPQLSGPGVAGREVRRLSGFEALFGPVRARDIPEYLAKGIQPGMRRVTFTFTERLVLVPVELTGGLKPAAALLVAFFLVGGLGGGQGYWHGLAHGGLFAVLAVVMAALAGMVATPLLLPWLPGRAFSLKGLGPGLAVFIFLALAGSFSLADWAGRLECLAWLLMAPSLASFTAMNFTGASNFTSLSGVRKEMRTALPLQIAAGGIGLAAWLAALVL